ncbi:hypothetical protein ACOME3_008953 [Neoechinorhynchus agilis]
MSRSPPHLVKPASVSGIDSNGTVCISFEVKAAPKPTYGWTLNGNPIREGFRHKTDVKGNAECYIASLSIKKFNKDDCGVYKCEVRNFKGQLNVELPVTSIPKLENIQENVLEQRDPEETPVEKTKVADQKISKLKRSTSQRGTNEGVEVISKTFQVFFKNIAVINFTFSSNFEPKCKWTLNKGTADLSKTDRYRTL